MMSNEDQNEDRNGHQIDVTPSSGNVFADMGLPNAKELLFKADLVIAISEAIRRHRLSQNTAAKLVGMDQPKISALMAGDTRGFSTDRLLRILTRLGQDVEIRVHDSPRTMGRVRVAA